MENLIIEATSITPYIHIDQQSGLIEIRGKSIPENPYEFYKPIWEWVSVFEKEAPPAMEVNVKMEYFNSSTLKCLIDIFKRLAAIRNTHPDTSLVFNWYYVPDDEDMMEAGQDCEGIIGIPFNLIEV